MIAIAIMVAMLPTMMSSQSRYGGIIQELIFKATVPDLVHWRTEAVCRTQQTPSHPADPPFTLFWTPQLSWTRTGVSAGGPTAAGAGSAWCWRRRAAPSACARRSAGPPSCRCAAPTAASTRTTARCTALPVWRRGASTWYTARTASSKVRVILGSLSSHMESVCVNAHTQPHTHARTHARTHTHTQHYKKPYFCGPISFRSYVKIGAILLHWCYSIVPSLHFHYLCQGTPISGQSLPWKMQWFTEELYLYVCLFLYHSIMQYINNIRLFYFNVICLKCKQ